MKYKLFISDYDRTLGDRDYIDPSTVEAIKEYERRGGKFVIVSGRVKDSITEICQKYGFVGLVGAYQGGMVKDIESGKVLYDHGIDKELAVCVFKDFISEKFDTTVDVDGIRYSVKGDGKFLDYYKNFGGSVENLLTADEVLKKIEATDKPIEKICAMINPDDVYSRMDSYSKKYPEKLLFTSGGPVILECINAKYNKGYAVRFIADYYGVPLSEVIAIGDAPNDVPLIDGEWYGVAVGNGCDKIKQVADEVAVEFKLNPVKQMLEKYCLTD